MNLLLALVFGSPAVLDGPDDAFADRVRPVLTAHCAGCHGGPRPKGEVDLARFVDGAAAREEPDVWRRVRTVLSQGAMPPAERARPATAEVSAVLSWIDGALRSAPVDPGRSTARRLNRLEYRNTIRDLFGVSVDVERVLPADAVGETFDNQGDALSLPPILLEKYLDLAESVADEVVLGERRGAERVRRLEGEALSSDREARARRGVRVLATVGEVFAHVPVPRAGHYVLRVRAHASRAGDELARMEVTLDGRALEAFEVDALAMFERHLHLEAGAARLGAAFRNDYYDPEHPDPDRRDRNLYVHWIELEGPLDPPPLDPLVGRFLPDADGGEPDFERLTRAVLRRAFRRPPTGGEVARWIAFAGAGGGTLHDRVHRLLVAVLVAPEFLFRIERHPDPQDPTAVAPLDDHALAARLAAFLWASVPDPRLDALADRGVLREPRVLLAELRRMLRDPRASALAEGFAEQWLQLRRLRDARPDEASFGFDEALREAMIGETLQLFESVLREERPVHDLIDGGYTFVNERLAGHYGMEGVRGERLRRVPFEDEHRAGILTHASILTLTSNPTRTSPVKRGKWILEAILATPPNPPPATVPPLDESESATRGASLRERLELHRADPACAVCHVRMDALGFALEGFDPVGRRRERDGAFAIDARGELPDGRTFEGARGLQRIVREEGGLVRSLVQHLWQYGLGRALLPADRLEVERLVSELLAQEREEGLEITLRTILERIVLADAFQNHRGDGR